MSLPTVAISIQQPWAWLIVNGYKDIENRSWGTSRRGSHLVHTGKKVDQDAHEALLDGMHPATYGALSPAIYEAYGRAHAAGEVRTGGIVGVVDIVDCVTDHPSDWFQGENGFVLENGRTLPFMPARGQLGFFPVEYQAPA